MTNNPLKPFIFITKQFEFHAAHRLPGYKGKCNQLHGHTWQVIITLKEQVHDDGISIDFKEFKNTVNERIINHLDHTYLNDRMEHPTAENICRLIWAMTQSLYQDKIHQVTVKESQDSWVTLTKESYCIETVQEV